MRQWYSTYIALREGIRGKENSSKGHWKRQRELDSIKLEFRKRMEKYLNESK